MALQAVLQDALEKGEYWRLRDAQGKPPGVVGWWPSRAVTFLDNHDTGGAMLPGVLSSSPSSRRAVCQHAMVP